MARSPYVVIRKEGLCPNSGDINRLMMMMLIRGGFKVAPMTTKMRSYSLAWYGHVMRKDEIHIMKRVMSMNVDGHPRRGRGRLTLLDNGTIMIMMIIFYPNKSNHTNKGLPMA
jgi:hypothetical protein